MTKDFIFDLYIDSKTKISPKIWVVKGDTNGNRFIITLKDKDGFSEKAVDLTNTDMITLVFSKSDGNVVVGNAFITEPVAGKFEYTMKGNEIAYPGDVECEVQVYGADSRYTTSRFTFEVKESLDSDEAIESTTEYTCLTTLITNVQSIETIEAQRVAAENIRISNESARESAEEKRITNEKVRNQSETTRASAEQARVTAEDIRANHHDIWTTAETERQAAETQRLGNEANRVSNESARDEAESIRDTEEDNRISAENLRELAETKRESSEDLRITAELNRQVAEATRATAEQGREAAETARADSYTTWAGKENERQTAESQRIDNEENRTANEVIRQANEQDRITAEQNRVSAELTRASKEIERINAESERVDNESDRETAETERAGAESTRKSSETQRNNAETDRNTAESERSDAESTRTANETARISSEADRSAAENDRIKKETERINAELARASAEAERIAAELERESNESIRETLSNQLATLKTDLESLKTTLESLRESLESGNYGDMFTTKYDPDKDGKVLAADSADTVPWSGVSGKPTSFAPSSHTHAGGDVTSKVASAANADTVSWAGVSGKPSSYPPASHNHDSSYEPLNDKSQLKTSDKSTIVGAVNELFTSKVPTERTVNGKALSADITLTAEDVGAETSAGAQAKANAAESNAKVYADGVGTAAVTTAKAYTDQEVGAVAGDLASHKSDYTKQVPYAVTSGSANAYIVSTDPALPALVSGVAIAVKIHAANTGASTLTWNGKGAKAIKKANGNDVASGNLKLNGVYTLRYDGTSFILQGEGGEYGNASPSEVLKEYSIGTEEGVQQGTLELTGDAVASDVLANKTFYNTNAKSKQTGNIPVNGNQTATLQITGSAKPTKVVSAGYTPGGTITAELSASLASIILKNNTIGGVPGTLEPGKKFAKGTVSNGLTTFSVSGLGFRPKYVIFANSAIGPIDTTSLWGIIIEKNLPSTDKIYWTNQSVYAVIAVRNDSGWYVNYLDTSLDMITDNGFNIQSLMSGANSNARTGGTWWIAIGD